MDNDVKAWLYDILTAINEIESFFVDRPKDFWTYKKDLRTKRAVERNIEIIGEAMNRILKQLKFLIQGKLLLFEIELFMVMIRFQMK